MALLIRPSDDCDFVRGSWYSEDDYADSGDYDYEVSYMGAGILVMIMRFLVIMWFRGFDFYVISRLQCLDSFSITDVGAYVSSWLTLRVLTLVELSEKVSPQVLSLSISLSPKRRPRRCVVYILY